MVETGWTHPAGERCCRGIENLDHLAEDSREICFEQGKPCVYQDEDRPDHSAPPGRRGP